MKRKLVLWIDGVGLLLIFLPPIIAIKFPSSCFFEAFHWIGVRYGKDAVFYVGGGYVIFVSIAAMIAKYIVGRIQQTRSGSGKY